MPLAWPALRASEATSDAHRELCQEVHTAAAGQPRATIMCHDSDGDDRIFGLSECEMASAMITVMFVGFCVVTALCATAFAPSRRHQTEPRCSIVPLEGSPVYPFRAALACLDDCCGKLLDSYTKLVCLPFQLKRKLCGKNELALPPPTLFTIEEGDPADSGAAPNRFPVVRDARVRSGANLSSQEIGILKPGDYVQILEEVTRDGHQRIRIREGTRGRFTGILGGDAWVSRVTDEGTVLVEAPPGGLALAAQQQPTPQLSDGLLAEESPEVARKSLIYIQDMRSCYLINAALCLALATLAWGILIMTWAKQQSGRQTPLGRILPATAGFSTYGQSDLREFREPQTISVTVYNGDLYKPDDEVNYNSPYDQHKTVVYCTSAIGVPNALVPYESWSIVYNDAARFRMEKNGAYACIFCEDGVLCSESFHLPALLVPHDLSLIVLLFYHE